MLDTNTDEFIKNKLTDIINYTGDEWIILDNNIKIKILHNYCNNYLKKRIDCGIKIPLKSLKPKKIIQLCNFSKEYNKELYKSYLDSVLEYTFIFRDKYKNCKDRKIFNYEHLSVIDRDNILCDLNKLVYEMLNNNKNNINTMLLYNNLLLNNKDKVCLINDKYDLKIIISGKELKFVFNENNIVILNLILTGDRITNNIPVIYNISLLNNIIKH